MNNHGLAFHQNMARNASIAPIRRIRGRENRAPAPVVSQWVHAIQDMPWPVEACELETVVDNDTVGTVPIFICLQIQD